MKKPTFKTTQRRKLVLRRETVIELTPLQLTKVAGGWTMDWPCEPNSQQALCADETIG
jgi:hypothetical protein